MHASYVSTAALRNATRTELLRLQSELTDRTTEVATARKADVGLALGAATGRTLASRNELSLIEVLRVSNGAATARLEQTQAALADLQTVGSEMVASLTALPPGAASATTMTIQARSSLDRLVDRLNASDGGSYIFGGQNSANAPMHRFGAGPEAAIDAAFFAKFGLHAGDPATASISVADMQDFLANEYDNLFDMPSWRNDWSDASSDNVVSQITPSERLETGTNANKAALRGLAKGLSMIAGLGFESLSQEVRDAIVASSRVVVAESITGIVALKGELGFAENAVGRADDKLVLARDLLETRISAAEGADAAEAKVRIDLLTTQIEMSYALTAQLARLSILNYAR